MYWSSTPYHVDDAYELYFYSDHANWNNYSRVSGLSVRPVR